MKVKTGFCFETILKVSKFSFHETSGRLESLLCLTLRKWFLCTSFTFVGDKDVVKTRTGQLIYVPFGIENETCIAKCFRMQAIEINSDTLLSTVFCTKEK